MKVALLGKKKRGVGCADTIQITNKRDERKGERGRKHERENKHRVTKAKVVFSGRENRRKENKKCKGGETNKTGEAPSTFSNTCNRLKITFMYW